MANKGARQIYFAPFVGDAPEEGMPTYAEELRLSKLVQVDTAITMAAGELYADDELSEQASEFVSATSTVQITDVNADISETVFGATVDDNGEVISNKDDEAPYGGLGYIRVGQVDGVTHYQPIFFPKARAALANETDQTKAASITFNTSGIPFTVFPLPDGNWRFTQRFTGADAYTKAKAYLTAKYAGTPVTP